MHFVLSDLQDCCLVDYLQLHFGDVSTLLFPNANIWWCPGRYLVANILQRDDVELAFVWNRNNVALKGHVDDAYVLESLDDVSERKQDSHLL